MTIQHDELRKIFDTLLAHLEEQGESIEITWDYYWNIPREEIYNPYDEPESLDIGQLSEDWERLRAIESGKMPPVSIAFAWLAAILRAVGEETFT